MNRDYSNLDFISWRDFDRMNAMSCLCVITPKTSFQSYIFTVGTHQYNANVKIIYIEKSPEVIFKQNAKREDSIPVSAIEKMLKRWEIPKVWEGYEVQYIVDN